MKNKRIAYVFENNYEISYFSDREEAIREYEYSLGMKTEKEKSELDYYRVYEIETECNPEELEGDPADYMTEMVRSFK